MHFTKKTLFKISLVLFLTAMFLFPIPTLKGATNGLLLWFETILPTLLPFIILSNIMINLNVTEYICLLFSPIFTKIFKISKGGTYPVIMGILSGFPMGAKASADMVISGKISRKEGQFLVSLCNNASIMFITSYIAVSTLNRASSRYLILAVLYSSSIISSIFARRVLPLPKGENQTLQDGPSCSTAVTFRTAIDNSIMDGFEVITKIGGYIILFSILAQMMLSFVTIDSLHIPALFITGILEITTGVHMLGTSGISENLKFVLVCTLTAFGGLSSFAQTYSVLGGSGLSAVTYFKTKIMNAAVAFIISFLYVMIS